MFYFKSWQARRSGSDGVGGRQRDAIVTANRRRIMERESTGSPDNRILSLARQEPSGGGGQATRTASSIGVGAGGFGSFGGGIGSVPYRGQTRSGSSMLGMAQTGNAFLDYNVIDSWIPYGPLLTYLYRLIYKRDPVCGTAVDVYKTLPWSEYNLLGIDDQKVLQAYYDSLEDMNILTWLPEISADFLVHGVVIAHLLFNEGKGYFDSLIVHNRDNIAVKEPVFSNMDPVCDLLPNPDHRLALTDDDPRIQHYLHQMDANLKAKLIAGETIPLHPANTLYLPRRAFAYDWEGTSLFDRALYYIAMERPRMTAQALARCRLSRFNHGLAAFTHTFRCLVLKMACLRGSCTASSWSASSVSAAIDTPKLGLALTSASGLVQSSSASMPKMMPKRCSASSTPSSTFCSSTWCV
jgi:hypothetical protein